MLIARRSAVHLQRIVLVLAALILAAATLGGTANPLARKVNEYEGQHFARKVNEYEGQHFARKVNEYEGQHRVA